MNRGHEGPIIESSHDGNLSGNPKRVAFTIFGVLVILGIGAFFMVEDMVEKNPDVWLEKDIYYDAHDQEMPLEEIAAEPAETTEPTTKAAEAIEEIKETPEFYYKRALQKETEKDYKGAVADYDHTITLAKRYSAEMFNALNNRGVIKSEQFKDYRGAKKDFNKIIEIETNRYDGNANRTRLEAGYTNRAYVRKMLGDKDGACEDLYEALAIATESSTSYIEKQLEKNCY